MRTLGIIGGIAPESTIEYYRSIITLYHSRRADGSYPPLIINSIDMQKMLGMIGAGELATVTQYLLDEVRKLARAGADFALLASNTPHIVFDGIQRESPIPLLSIVESACRAALTLGMKKVGRIGTQDTRSNWWCRTRLTRNTFTASTWVSWSMACTCRRRETACWQWSQG